MSGRIGGLSAPSLRMTCPRTQSVPIRPQGSLSGRAIPLGSQPMSWMTPRRVLHTLTAPAEVRSPAWTAEPAVTPTPTMPAALVEILPQRACRFSSHMLPVAANERGDLHGADDDAGFVEGLEPRLDARGDGVDQGPVEVERDGRRRGRGDRRITPDRLTSPGIRGPPPRSGPVGTRDRTLS